jgi:hypothetical protein
MYDSTMNDTIQMGYTIEHLTKSERARLKKMVLGYGNFNKTANRSGLHINTFRNIIDKGYGVPESIQKIRENVLGYSTKTANAA